MGQWELILCVTSAVWEKDLEIKTIDELEREEGNANGFPASFISNSVLVSQCLTQFSEED